MSDMGNEDMPDTIWLYEPTINHGVWYRSCIASTGAHQYTRTELVRELVEKAWLAGNSAGTTKDREALKSCAESYALAAIQESVK